ncbi:MAG: serine/threonine-protein kinase [Methylicorpusculum sp.]|uniref:serine/threonine protein kinase n=1 Tax=Methylicorpusculum sp. TaxID=2713644 RepID=UPI0027166C82|nr:serine/threonine-protein kinase [Methylicorpusculum sp.]MDO8845214.1 serine/threonine-protein kinase [Methylicorpusculum sp.]MDO8937664.1 serine/threonine-protein kinase [Methylicorpusculum sp.]MDP2201959.1 serine/threonine-protein kinase [Methylicorpusculum sp.]
MTDFYDPSTYPKQWNYLQSGTIIDDYIIERELAHGGFSSVYLARQRIDQIQVAIKEYLPRKLAHRTWNNHVVAHSEENRDLFMRGRSLFFEEAKALATLKHPNIVDVINFFQENSTVYMVMTYDYGFSLDKILKDRLITITHAFLVKVFTALLSGIGFIHEQQLLHLDIKPANILIRPENDPLLLDFGAIQSFPNTIKNKNSKILTKGFSPIEQYNTTSQLGPWTDIYAIGASIRACLDLKASPPAPERNKKDTLSPAVKAHKKKFPTPFLEAIDWAMEIQPKDRPQSINEFLNAFNA